MNATQPIRFLVLLFTVSPTYLAWSQPVDSSSTSRPMSLEMCLAYAFQHNANVESAVIEQQIARRDVNITKAQGFPQLNIDAGYTNNYIIQTSLVDAEGFPGVADDPNAPDEIEIQLGIKHQSQAVASLSQMIFDGSYFVGLKAARVYTDLARKGLDQTKVTTAEQVTKAYYTALVNQERQQLLESNYQRLDSLLRETQIMFDNGFAESIDVGRVRVQYNNAETDLKNNQRLTEVSYLLLKFQMGMPIEQAITLADKISEVEFSFEEKEESEFNYVNRPEYAQVLVNQSLVQLDARNNRVQYLPKLDFVANYGMNTGATNFSDLTDGSRWYEFGSWGLSLNIPIFDGLLKFNSIQKNKLQLQQLESQSKFLENQIDLEIVQARVNLQNSLEALNVQQENLELAQEIFDVTEVKYQEGVGSNLEVTEAQNALQQAETNYYDALYNALISRVDLKKALGILVAEDITE